MSLEADVAQILTTVRWIEDTIRAAGFGGPRILPGDGSKPPDTKPADPPPANPITRPSNPILDGYASSNPMGTGGGPAPTLPLGEGGGYDRSTFDFRNGDILRFQGSGSRSVTATAAAGVSFSVGEMGGNGAKSWRITVRRNGLAIYGDTVSTYQTVPPSPLPVLAGDVVTLDLVGEGLILSARLALS